MTNANLMTEHYNEFLVVCDNYYYHLCELEKKRQKHVSCGLVQRIHDFPIKRQRTLWAPFINMY